MIPSIANIRKAIYCLNKRIDLLEGGDYLDTMVELSNKISALESLLDDDALNPTKAIDKFNEIVAFLDSIDNTETLLELLRDVIQLSYQQNYVTVPTYASLPATGSADTIYRVSNYNGSTNQIDTTSYSEYVWDNSDYTLLCVKSLMSEVFDISAYHATGSTLAKYTDLTAALDSNNGGGVPQSFQKGGMSIKFVQSSDNKYVQYRLAASGWSTDIHDWTSEDPYFIDKIMQEVNEAIDEHTPIEITGDVTNAPDEEDLTSVNVGGTDVLKFKDKAYNQLTYSGMGRKILRKNMVNGVNTLTQDMFYKGEVGSREPNTNTIFVIQYDYVIDSANDNTITIPANCVLKFEGGSLRNGVLTSTGGMYIESNTKCFDNVIIPSTCKLLNDCSRLSWWHRSDDDCTSGLQIMADINAPLYIDLWKVNISHPIVFNKSVNNIMGIEPVKAHGSHALYYMTTLIQVTDNWDSNSYDADSMFLFDSTHRTEIKYLNFRGNFKVNYAIYSKVYYIGNITKCSFYQIALTAIKIGGTENTRIESCYFCDCGCAIYACAREIDEENILNLIGAPTGGTISQLKILDNYIAFCNYGIVAETNINFEVIGNGISYCSCWAVWNKTQHDTQVYSNYLEGDGVSSFWIEKGITEQQLAAQKSSVQLAPHLANTHKGEAGENIPVGWGVKDGDNRKMRGFFYFYSSVDIPVSATISLIANSFSTNHVRTKSASNKIDEDDTKTGVDMCYVLGDGVYRIADNRVNFPNLVPQYGGYPKYFIGYNGVMPKINNSGYTIMYFSLRFNIKIDNLPAAYSSREISPWKQWFYAAKYSGNSIYEATEIFNAVSLKKSSNYPDIFNCAFKWYHNMNYSQRGRGNDNIASIASSVKIINGIPLYEFPNSIGLLKQGIMFLVDASYFLDETKEIMFYLRNDGQSDKTISIESIRMSSTVSRENIRSIASAVISLKKNSEMIIRYIINPSDLESTDEYLCFGFANSTNNEIAEGLFMSVPYIRSINEDWSHVISSNTCNELGLKISGTTALRPAHYNVMEQGFKYFDEDLNKTIFLLKSNTSTRWIEEDGATAGVARSGEFANAPAADDIYEGFMYTINDGANHFPIYAHINNDAVEWYKADGTQYTG